jgi:hypothetical protein
MNIDVLLCKKVWGEEYSNNPEYQKYLEAISRGRDAASINNDLRERIAHHKKLPQTTKSPEQQQW